MTWSDVQALVEQWHSAFRKAADGDDGQANLVELQRQLLMEIKSHRHLLQLATNPLLTALLCALNLDRRMLLPRDRLEVSQSCS